MFSCPFLLVGLPMEHLSIGGGLNPSYAVGYSCIIIIYLTDEFYSRFIGFRVNCSIYFFFSSFYPTITCGGAWMRLSDLIDTKGLIPWILYLCRTSL